MYEVVHLASESHISGGLCRRLISLLELDCAKPCPRSPARAECPGGVARLLRSPVDHCGRPATLGRSVGCRALGTRMTLQLTAATSVVGARLSRCRRPMSTERPVHGVLPELLAASWAMATPIDIVDIHQSFEGRYRRASPIRGYIDEASSDRDRRGRNKDATVAA